MRKDYVGLRLNAEKDNDIISDLAKFKDRTARVKEAYRKVLELESKGFVLQSPITQDIQDAAAPKKIIYEEVQIKSTNDTKLIEAEVQKTQVEASEEAANSKTNTFDWTKAFPPEATVKQSGEVATDQEIKKRNVKNAMINSFRK